MQKQQNNISHNAWERCCAFLASEDHRLMIAIVGGTLPPLHQKIAFEEYALTGSTSLRECTDFFLDLSAQHAWGVIHVREPFVDVLEQMLCTFAREGVVRDVHQEKTYRVPATVRIILVAEKQCEKYLSPELFACASTVFREE